NMPFLWDRDTETQTVLIDSVRGFADTVNVFLNHGMHKKILGEFDETVMEKLAVTSKLLNDRKMHLIVDLFDGNDIKRGINLVWGWHGPKGPFGAEGEYGFYYKKEYQEAYLKLVEFVAGYRAQLPNLRGVVVGNELGQLWWPGGKEKYEEWLARCAPAVKNAFPDIMVLSGEADPRDSRHGIKGIDIKTIHFYEYTTDFMGLQQYLEQHPAYPQEFGVEEAVLGFKRHKNLDQAWLNFLDKIFDIGTSKGPASNRVNLNFIGRPAPWKTDEYDDKYNFMRKAMKMTTGRLDKYNEIRERAVGF
ncbi:MAG TPA: hypothetical protein VF828_04415, partial [Patescibacteria group bacterium]